MYFRIVACLLLGLALAACKESGVKNMPPAAPVRVAAATQGSLTRALNAVGNVEASATVDIIPRVAGEIVAVRFREGDEVRAGQSLIQIDPRPYAAALAEKKANLAKSEAQLAKAERDRRRFAQLAGNGYVSREAYEQMATDAAALRATARAGRAAVEAAALDLAYTDIKAPISGRAGPLKMQKGAMLKSNETIVTIDTISPCRVVFSAPESWLPAIQARLARGDAAVTATTRGGGQARGRLTLIDNQVDTRAGTIRLRADFPNADKSLWPGQFVEARLPLGEVANAVIVPTRAVQTGREESYVYVITPDNRAEYRKVKAQFDADGQTAVSGAIKPGEKVVVDGHVRLAPGISVNILE